MRLLVACEESGVVTAAFRARGVKAWSCDLLPTRGNPAWHIQEDVLWLLKRMKWDAMIGFPPCPRLCNSGVLRLYVGGKKINGIDSSKWREMIEAANFFKALLYAEIPLVALENPIMHGWAREIIQSPYSQTVQPYEFGHPESKRTCFWLRGFPLLKPTNILKLPESGHWSNQTPSGQNKLGPSKHRARIRATTYSGIAEAMASQWRQTLQTPINLL